ncbi:uncharacterized protein LOC110023926 [Phalaenopsis equestris]|uniref:uncharacterized protein LOC110023926 n=1 Tax=Phalaenopsis equestris TaxID=78828 RepID=UPI0009E50271|nr:uncharacterized protein LOC110023926 [Phalaenopsis equestris]
MKMKVSISLNPTNLENLSNCFSLAMEKRLTLIQTVAAAGLFSAVSFWYGFMFGRESARKDLEELIDHLRRGSAKPDGSAPNESS